MKKIMYLAGILVSLAFQTKAQTSNLVIFDQQGEQFYVIVNGVLQNSTAQTNVRITGLSAPAGYKVRVQFRDSLIPPVDKSIYMQNSGTEVTADVVIKKNGEHVLRWVSESPLAQAATPPANQATMAYSTTPPPANTGTTTTTVTQQTTTDPNGGSVSVNMNGMGTGMNVNMTGTGAQTTVTTTTTTTSSSTTTSTGGDMSTGQTTTAAPAQTNYVDGYSGPVGCPMPMAHDDYENAKNTINGKSFESDKLTIAKQIASSNCLTAGQVKGIMMLFSFEDSKLDFAKYAYTHTYDKGNYYKVNDAFQFSSSTDTLNQYISSGK